MKAMSPKQMLALIAKLESEVVSLKSKRRNVRGKSGDPNRGKWCTAKRVADAVGSFDLDPFSNPYSHIVSRYRCMLEDGGNGLLVERGPGWFRQGKTFHARANEDTSTWIQPPYDIVQQALDHYGHTCFTALLRFDPRPKWFHRIYAMSELVCVLRHCNFEPPPGVKASSNTFPHALFYRRAEDVTDDVLRLCISWRKKRHG